MFLHKSGTCYMQITFTCSACLIFPFVKAMLSSYYTLQCFGKRLCELVFIRSLITYPPTAYSRFPMAATPTRARRVDMDATMCQRSVLVSYASQSPWMANKLPPPANVHKPTQFKSHQLFISFSFKNWSSRHKVSPYWSPSFRTSETIQILYKNTIKF